MVGRQVLALIILVRIQVSQQLKNILSGKDVFVKRTDNYSIMMINVIWNSQCWLSDRSFLLWAIEL